MFFKSVIFKAITNSQVSPSLLQALPNNTMSIPFKLAKPAAAGFQKAAHYDLNRPSYVKEAVDQLLTHLKVASQTNARIVDLASGTGKFTELIAARPERYDIKAIEPHNDMRVVLAKKDLGARVSVLNGDAGKMPVEEGWADALVAAQVRITLIIY